MIIKSIQNKNVLETLNAGNTHFAKDTNIENLIKPYHMMANHYHWTTSPVFGCVVGRRCEFYGANTNDAVILTLNVPDELVKLQVYYDWVDVIYYTECLNEWEYDNFDEFVADVLNGTKTDDQNISIQATIPYIKPEWLINAEPITSNFVDRYYGSGGSNVLE